MKVLKKCGEWDPAKDSKLQSLLHLITKVHGKDKVIVFTQFADTVRYLGHEFKARSVQSAASVTGSSSDPTSYAWRFSPISNNKGDIIPTKDQLRVLIATDVLSEGQNLQDGAIIVNYDLPWAIIRLVQRAGRVDRIGQKADEILCYSFLPAEGAQGRRSSVLCVIIQERKFRQWHSVSNGFDFVVEKQETETGVAVEGSLFIDQVIDAVDGNAS
jgi:superfamily II DNA/RNA helicase